jgi:carboxymethylenebutenolidase
MCTAPGEDVGQPVRRAVKEEERRIIAGDGAPLREFLAEPVTGFRRGAVLIVHDIWGYTDFYKGLARRITEQGHAAALVDFFSRQGQLPQALRAPETTTNRAVALARAQKRAQRLPDERVLADIQTAVDDLRSRGAARVACWGFCLGGRLAYLAAARVRGLAGAVSYYGFLKADAPRLSPLALASEIRIPVLAVFAGADEGIRPEEISSFEKALAAEKEVVTYPGAPHGFLRYGANEHQDAIDDALRRTYGFLSRVLSG